MRQNSVSVRYSVSGVDVKLAGLIGWSGGNQAFASIG